MTDTSTDFLPFHRADIGDAEVKAVVDVLTSGWLTTGARTKEFEAAFAGRVGAKHAVAVNSATAALHLALEAIGVSSGDEVVVPAMTFAASAEVVVHCGGRPVFADCDPATLTLRVEDVERVFTSRTKAVMPVHYAGHPCEMAPILDHAKAHGIKVIEDAAHSFPASYRGRPVGAIGDVTAFSFYATKTLTTGEGGMLTTDDEEFANRARIMSLHGISRHAWNRYAATGSWRYEILEAGFKYNLTDIAAALGLIQLQRADELLCARRRVAERYDRGFAGINEVQVPVCRPDVQSAWHLYPIRVKTERLRIGRDQMIEALRDRGIGTSVHFIPLHLHPYYQRTLGSRAGECPNAEAAFEQMISLPLYPGLTDADIDRVVGAVIDLVNEHRR
jgi:perosamine synthetase